MSQVCPQRFTRIREQIEVALRVMPFVLRVLLYDLMMHIPRLVEHLSHLRGSAARANPYQLYSYAP